MRTVRLRVKPNGDGRRGICDHPKDMTVGYPARRDGRPCAPETGSPDLFSFTLTMPLAPARSSIRPVGP